MHVFSGSTFLIELLIFFRNCCGFVFPPCSPDSFFFRGRFNEVTMSSSPLVFTNGLLCCRHFFFFHFLVYGAASSLITIFSSLLPIGFIAMPLVGYFVDKRGYPDTFHMVNVSGILWGIGLLFPSYWLQIMSYLVFSTNRQFVFSTFFAYSAQRSVVVARWSFNMFPFLNDLLNTHLVLS